MRHTKFDLTMNIYTDPALLDVLNAPPASAAATGPGQTGNRPGNRDRRRIGANACTYS
jgi:hypothetical protein